MPRSSTGRSVARAAATGGGRTYRGQRPVNWYAALVVIVIVGIVSILYSRSEYRNPSSASSTPPTIGTTWYAGYALDVCGIHVTPLSASTNSSTVGLTTLGDGVIQISPLTKADAGNNATLGRFTSKYPKLVFSNTSLGLPGDKTQKNGDVCGVGSPDAGKKGVVKVAFWPNVVTNSSVSVTDPVHLKLTQHSLVTIGFVPAGTKLSKPPASTITAVLSATATSVTTTTTGVAATTTTAASATTTTTTPATTTTAATATTTKSSTTTTKK